MTDIPEQDLQQRVNDALSVFLESDIDLLTIAANERTITHRFAQHLAALFPDWHVDCEYNRDGHEVKRANGIIVVPDIIVHRRLTKDNLLIIEAKKSDTRAPDEDDLQKLGEMKMFIGYQYALFVKFTVGPTPGIERMEWV